MSNENVSDHEIVKFLVEKYQDKIEEDRTRIYQSRNFCISLFVGSIVFISKSELRNFSIEFFPLFIVLMFWILEAFLLLVHDSDISKLTTVGKMLQYPDLIDFNNVSLPYTVGEGKQRDYKIQEFIEYIFKKESIWIFYLPLLLFSVLLGLDLLDVDIMSFLVYLFP